MVRITTPCRLPSRWPTLLAGALLLAGGCSAPRRPLLVPDENSPVWPPPPHQARIRYLGQIASADDLGATRPVLAALGDLIAGRKEPVKLYGPRAAVCTPDGRFLFVSDPGGRCLHLFDLEQRRHRRILGPDQSPLLTPVDLCLGPDGSVFVCDSEAVAIHRYDAATGRWLESLRVPDELMRPAALAYDFERDELLVADSAGHDIKVLDRQGRLLRIIGRRGAAPGEFNFPCGIALAGQTLWVADAGNHRVQGLDLRGEPKAVFGHAGDAPGDLALPKDVAVDSDGHVYVVDARFENVQVFDEQGRLLLFFGQEGSGPGEFWLPGGIFIDANDRIWICDTYNGRLQVFEYLKLEQSDTSDKADAP